MLDSNAAPLIDVAGDPKARGQSHGEQARQRIALGITNYRIAYEHLGIGWNDACTIAGRYIDRLGREEPDLLQEIDGIASGAGVRIEEILALNCRTEIIYGSLGETDEPTDGCTGAIALPDVTASGHVLHGQNWDWRDDCADTIIVLRIAYEDGLQVLTQTEAGIVARCGLNSSGIALTGNFLRCDRDNSPGGIPIPFVRRRVLEQTTFCDAMEVALKAPKSFSTNLMISDAGGECIDLEAVPGETFWLHADDGLLVHSNHFESPAALAKVRDTGVLVTPCTLYRSRRVRDYLRRYRGSIDLDRVKQALGDKFGSPAGVCASPQVGSTGTVWSTVATILMDVTERTMWVATRPYREHSYTRYDLASRGDDT
jgi:isopenicillin-N N-acyltransferase-like protein